MNGDGMEPRIKQGSAVFIDEGAMPEAEGNVILCDIDGRLAVVGFQGAQDVTLIDGSVQRKYIVKYDNAPAEQVWAVDEGDIIGRAISYDTTLGAVIRFASSKTGMLVIVIVPCALLVIYEIIMLVISMKKGKTNDDMELEEIDTIDTADMNFSTESALDFGRMSKKPTEKKQDLQFDKALTQKPAEPAKADAKPATDWEAKYNDLNDRYLRMAAEYDNFRKRSQREREQAYTDAVSRAVTALTMTQLTESLKGINVTVIDAAAGTVFDPNFHNAVMHVEDENLGENVIAETFQQGFQIGDKVIRHAMVKVAN